MNNNTPPLSETAVLPTSYSATVFSDLHDVHTTSISPSKNTKIEDRWSSTPQRIYIYNAKRSTRKGKANYAQWNYRFAALSCIGGRLENQVQDLITVFL